MNSVNSKRAAMRVYSRVYDNLRGVWEASGDEGKMEMAVSGLFWSFQDKNVENCVRETDEKMKRQAVCRAD